MDHVPRTVRLYALFKFLFLFATTAAINSMNRTRIMCTSLWMHFNIAQHSRSMLLAHHAQKNDQQAPHYVDYTCRRRPIISWFMAARRRVEPRARALDAAYTNQHQNHLAKCNRRRGRRRLPNAYYKPLIGAPHSYRNPQVVACRIL